MTTSGTTSFGLPIDEIVTDAYRMIGNVNPTGDSLRTAKRELDLMLIDWNNRGLNVWAVDNVLVSVSAATTTLSPTIQHVYEAVLIDGTTETELTLIDEKTYIQYPDKTKAGTPSVFYVQLKRDAPTLVVWPVPAAATSIRLHVSRQLEDTGGVYNTIDVPRRYLPAAVAGLASSMAYMAPALAPMLQARADRAWWLAWTAERERVSLTVRPA